MNIDEAAWQKQRDTLSTALATIQSLASLPSNAASHQLAMGRIVKIADTARLALRTTGMGPQR